MAFLSILESTEVCPSPRTWTRRTIISIHLCKGTWNIIFASLSGLLGVFKMDKKKGEKYECPECGLIVIIEDDGCECTECDVVCCSVPMELIAQKKPAKKAAAKKVPAKKPKAAPKKAAKKPVAKKKK